MDRMNETLRNSKTHYARNGLTKDEINELKAAFDLFDIKGEGYIDAKELKATMDSLEMQSKNKMVYNIIESIPNGRLNFDQFLDMMTTRIANTDSQDDIYKIFRILSDDTDYVTIENLQKVVAELGEPLTAFEIREMIERADVDGDNKVSFKEFYNIMTSKQIE